MWHMRSKKARSRKPGNFDPKDTEQVKHSRIGIWDLYKQQYPQIAQVPGSREVERRLEVLKDLPFVWRMLKDIASIKSCWLYLALYVGIEVMISLLPALLLWFSGQFLKIVQIAIDHRTVDKEFLFRIAMGRMVCTFVARLLMHAKAKVEIPLNIKIKQFYSIHIFNSMARLDLPTFEDPIIQRRLDDATTPARSQNSIAWETTRALSGLVSTLLRLLAQLSVLIVVVNEQRDATVYAILHFGQSLYQQYSWRTSYSLSDTAAWAATTTNEDYIRMQGMKRIVNDVVHRKELVAGNLREFLVAEFNNVSKRLQESAADFHEMLRRQNMAKFSKSSILTFPLQELPEVRPHFHANKGNLISPKIAFTLRAAQYPKSIPMSVASIRLIQETAMEFSGILSAFVRETGSIADRFHSIRQLYEVETIPNRVTDGNIPYPENQQALRSGISIEFRCVVFKRKGEN